MNAPVYAPCSGIATSTGPFGSTCATATPRRQPISAKLDAIAAAITTKTAWLRIWFRTVRTKNGISRVEAASKAITVEAAVPAAIVAGFCGRRPPLQLFHQRSEERRVGKERRCGRGEYGWNN